MSIEILDCLKRERDVCVKNVIPSQNTAFMWIPALISDDNNHDKNAPHPPPTQKTSWLTDQATMTCEQRFFLFAIAPDLVKGTPACFDTFMDSFYTCRSNSLKSFEVYRIQQQNAQEKDRSSKKSWKAEGTSARNKRSSRPTDHWVFL